MTQNCFRCETDIEQPVEQNANYVRGSDMVTRETQEVIFALKHTPETRAIRDEIFETQNLTMSKTNEAMVRNDSRFLRDEKQDYSYSIVDSDFTKVRIQSGEEVKEDSDIVRVDHEEVEIVDQKTGLICPKCLKDGDNIIWGIAEE